MAAAVETMMYAGKTPWHGEGTYVGDEPINSEQAIIMSGLDWTVSKQPLFAFVDGKPIPIPDRKALVRDTDNKVFAVTSNRYEPAQNIEAFRFMDSLVGEGLMRYHTAGALFGGSKVWILGKVGQSEIVPGDKVDHYLFLHNGHDAKTSLRVLWTDVRVVCANTARAALTRGAKTGISVRHRGDIMNSLDEAREVLGVAQEAFTESADFMRTLAETPMPTSDWVDFCLSLVPTPASDENGDVNKRAMNRVDKQRRDLTSLFIGGTGARIPGVQGTAWGAYNALTEYASHFRGNKGTTTSKRFDSLLLGTGNVFIQDGTDLLRELVH
jgi:phage/plasmid-like protein (TIGR03299 family)